MKSARPQFYSVDSEYEQIQCERAPVRPILSTSEGDSNKLIRTRTRDILLALAIAICGLTQSSKTVAGRKPGMILSREETASSNCPTGQPCGATAQYCQNYVPPSTNGARLISSLPYDVSRGGNYYLDSDLTSEGNGIYVTYQGGAPIDINLNGHTITYGIVANGSGPTAIGEYGILDCAKSTITRLDSSYKTNAYCANGPFAPSNITIENGTIIQSPNASQYYDSNNCPGSKLGLTPNHIPCSSHHETVMSDVIKIQNTRSVILTHLTLTWQNVDSNGLALDYEGSGFDIECNRFNDKVTQINNRAYQEGAAINMALGGTGQKLTTIKYNTMIGSPQSIINLNTGRIPADIEYNDMAAGYYQVPPYTAQVRGYSNDYAIYCPNGLGSAVAYNYIHSVNGRGIGCLYDGDTHGLPVHDNYVSTAELAANAEYGPNGEVNGGVWVGRCEIDGGRGWEAKGTASVQVYKNTFILNVGECGGADIVLTDYVSPVCAGCPGKASSPFSIHDNTLQVTNTGGHQTLQVQTQAACYLFDHSAGTYSNFFTPFLRENCTTDGDFVATDGFSPGDYFSFDAPTWARGNHPLSACGQDATSCGYMMHWQGVSTPPADELGFVFKDVSTGTGAALSFWGEHVGGAPLARSATVQWTYTVTVQNVVGSAISGATVGASDAGGQQSTCTTDSNGECSLELRQEVVGSPAGNARLTTTNENPNTVRIEAAGYSPLTYEVSVRSVAAASKTLEGAGPSQ